MQVENILQSKGRAVHTIAAGATVADAVELLNTRKIGAAVVVTDTGKVAGIVSERDVVRHLGKDWAALASRPVSEVMTKAVVTTGRYATIAEVMEKMTDKRIRHLPVLEDKKVIGVISIGDVVKEVISEQRFVIEQLEQYIHS